MTHTEALYHQWQSGQATAAEREELMRLLALPENEVLARQLLGKAIEADDTETGPRLASDRLQIVMDSILSTEVTVTEKNKVVRLSPKRWLSYAAALLLLTVAAWWAYHLFSARQDLPVDHLAGIGPGKDRAVLTLSDGSTILLDSAGSGALARQGEVVITKLSNGDIVYNAKGAEEGEVMMNTMATPRGGQYHLVLPDGTEVWLNAASSLRYPTIFKGNERRVEVTGELYFTIAPDKSKPFIVSLPNRSAIEVLGTSFNTNAYTDETSMNTTLVNGAVRVKKEGGGSVLLKPGQQAQLPQGSNTASAINIVNADMEKVIAWRKGLFNFEGASLEEAMKQLSRWYDIDIEFDKEVYTRGLQHTRLVGGIRRDLSLANVLELLNVMGLHFRMEAGRKLIVLP